MMSDGPKEVPTQAVGEPQREFFDYVIRRAIEACMAEARTRRRHNTKPSV